MKPAILLVDHGSRLPEANAQLDQVAALLRRRAPDRLVGVAHMELASPTIAEGLGACAAAGAREVVVHPYFLGPGAHTRCDLPRLVAEAAGRHPQLRVRVSEPLGVDERLVDLVLARVAEAEEAR